MKFDEMSHEFTLYRSGWAPPELEWPDNQLWARDMIRLDGINWQTHVLNPQFGDSRSHFRVTVSPVAIDAPEVGWVQARVSLDVDGMPLMSHLPIAWYVANPSDWPSGLARGSEVHGIHAQSNISVRTQALWALGQSNPRGVWTLAIRRHS